MSSSESEDENLKKFAEAVDVNLFNDNFYKPAEEKCEEEVKVETQKSQRQIDDEENVFHSEINVSEAMRFFIAKKMSAVIEKEIEFVDVKKRSFRDDDSSFNGVKLLRGFKECLRPDPEEVPQNLKKIPIKRRKVEEMDEKESTKVQNVATDITKIQRETSLWANKTKHPTYNFKTASDGKSHLQETSSEFIKARNKNAWNESKIKNAKNYGMSLNKAFSKS